MKKLWLWILVLIIIVGGIFLFTNRETHYQETLSIEEDTSLPELVIQSGESAIVRNNATLTIDGDTTIDGQLSCDNGDINFIVKGNLVVNELISCGSGGSIHIVVEGNLTMDVNAEITAEGNIQIVGSANDLTTTDEEVAALFDSIEEEEESGNVVGPLVDAGGKNDLAFKSLPTPNRLLTTVTKKAFAQATSSGETARNVRMKGKIRIDKAPPPGVKRIVIFYFPNATEITIDDLELSGPPGRKGAVDNGSCDVTGKDGEPAFRFLAFAPNLTVNNFTLNLGDGGEGGDAETSKDCDLGIARGGKGGKSGNAKMIASERFQILGSLMINPGISGNGGSAIAHGKDGGPGEKGGDARATGGDGRHNKKNLSFRGTVAGADKVEVGDLMAGGGAFASANPGKGGDAAACGEAGEPGGNGNATGGGGGDAKLTLSGGTRSALASDIGGAGATADTTGGAGGAGGDCGSDKAGGAGGKGGNATAQEGKGGLGDSGRSADGLVIDEIGGNGGKGGDGCLPGGGGGGGSGDPDGEKGPDGKNLCLVEDEETYVDPPREDEEKDMLEVIQWMDYFIRISDLRFVEAHEPWCSEQHWHADGPVTTVQGGVTEDPDPDHCGFCKISECPVMEIEEPSN